MLATAQINQLPVPVEEIAISLGADITYEPYDGDVSGMLYRSDEDALIGVGPNASADTTAFQHCPRDWPTL